MRAFVVSALLGAAIAGCSSAIITPAPGPTGSSAPAGLLLTGAAAKLPFVSRSQPGAILVPPQFAVPPNDYAVVTAGPSPQASMPPIPLVPAPFYTNPIAYTAVTFTQRTTMQYRLGLEYRLPDSINANFGTFYLAVYNGKSWDNVATAHVASGQTVTFIPDGKKTTYSATAPHGVALWQLADARQPTPVPSPSSVQLTAAGHTATIDVQEPDYYGTWTATSSNPKVATVSSTFGSRFRVTAVAAGKATVTFVDSAGGVGRLRVGVTTSGGGNSLMRALRGFFASIAVAGLAACSGAALPLAARDAAAPPAPVRALRVPMHVRIPRMPRGAHGRARRPFFVAASVQGIGVVVYAHGNRTTPLGTTTADVSASSQLCHASAGGRDCTVPIPAPPGNDDFVVTAYDAPPSHGSFSTAKKLAIGESTANIAKGKANAFAITLGGIVAGIAVSPALLSARAIAPSAQNLTVSAVDADGDVIVSDGYVDANGNPVSIALKADTSAGTTLTFAPASLASPSPSGVTVTYASTNATSAQIKNGFTSTLTATAAALSATATFSAALPVAALYPIPGGSTSARFIAPGPDRALWYTTFSEDTIGRVTSNGQFSTSGTIAGPTEQVAAGNDNAMWFTESTGAIGRFAVTTPGTVTEIAPPPQITLTAGITAGPSSDAASMWFTDPIDGLVARIPTASPSTGSISIYGPSPSMVEPGSITAGPDGNLWFDDCTAGQISKIPPNSPTGTNVAVTPYTIPALGGGSPSPVGIAVAPDGTIWFADPTNGTDGEIGRITTGGVISEFATSAPAYSVAAGPDGAMWYVIPSTNTIGRIDITTHAIDEFPSIGDGPSSIALGPDNALYVVDGFDSNVLRVQ